MLHTINLTKTGLQNYSLGGAPLEDVALWIDKDKTVPVWDYVNKKFWYGNLVARKSGYVLIYDTKFSAELASREGCTPVHHAALGGGVDFEPASWYNKVEALLIPRYDGDELQDGERIVYSLIWDKYAKVKLGVSTDWHYGDTGKYYPKSLGWVIIEYM